MRGFTCHPTRRTALRSMVGGSLLLPVIVSLLLAEDGPPDPLAPKKPHFTPKAKRVIWLFSTGGVSQMDTFDPKPKLIAADGKTLGAGGGLSNEKRPLVKPRWAFKPGGKCGTEVSDLFPHVAKCADDLAVVRSVVSKFSEHTSANYFLHTGSGFQGQIGRAHV